MAQAAEEGISPERLDRQANLRNHLMVKFYAVLKSLKLAVPLANAPDREHAEFFAKGAFGADLEEVIEDPLAA